MRSSTSPGPWGSTAGGPSRGARRVRRTGEPGRLRRRFGLGSGSAGASAAARLGASSVSSVQLSRPRPSRSRWPCPGRPGLPVFQAAQVVQRAARFGVLRGGFCGAGASSRASGPKAGRLGGCGLRGGFSWRRRARRPVRSQVVRLERSRTPSRRRRAVAAQVDQVAQGCRPAAQVVVQVSPAPGRRPARKGRLQVAQSVQVVQCRICRRRPCPGRLAARSRDRGAQGIQSFPGRPGPGLASAT